jgi:predicted RNA-binding Zn-ribbon protein involved in translation (DUF1610 family)
MSVTPSIDYKCPDCGATTIYQLVPMDQREPPEVGETAETPSINFVCSMCGASRIYMLSPANPAS